ncbi:DUF58 domain-containing protein [Kineosporia succinea]|uniref:Uncharacterized protein (DUF58 family) n=1 Tax=Kineosporia succinea TaxID=84632 RepID=A0ABT9PBU5_9ACTN|nr:DUF58 domain-containing protein [Kineosporia succinea]MDP9830166.1 uncharacterized protein (DUF58 family) [Kineosporia succinea]
MTRSGYAVLTTSAILTALGLTLGYPELTLAGLAGAGTLATALIWMLARPGLSAERVLEPERVFEGETVVSRLTIRNQKPLRTPPLTGRQELVGQLVPITVPALPPYGSVVETRTLHPVRRGVYPIPPVRLGHSDPFRLIASTGLTGTPVTLRVYPVPYPVAPLPNPHLQDADGLTSDPVLGGVTFHSLRDYHEGDDWRLVHWASSARAGRLIVRHNVLADEVHHCIVLDTSSAAYPDPQAFDDAVRLAASWCLAGFEAGANVLVKTTAGDEATTVPHGRPPSRPTAVLDLLASVAPHHQSPGIESVNAILSAHRGRALGVITGHTAADKLAALASPARPVSVVQIGVTDGPGPVLPGMRLVRALDGERAVVRWNRLVPA